MNIKEITLQNYKSFAGQHTFALDRGPGIHFVTGQNKKEDRLGSNGAGKSTLLGAVRWCLYGRDPDRLRAGDIKSWGVKGQVRVQADIETQGRSMTVLRTWGPNSLSVDGREVDQTELEGTIGLTENEFDHTILLSQLGRMFFDLSNTEKLSLLSNVLNLDYWLDKAQDASEVAKDLDAEVTDFNRKLDRVTTEIKVQRQNLKEYKQQEAKADKDNSEELSSIKKEIRKLESKVDRAQQAYKDIRDDLSGGKMLLEKYEKQHRDVLHDLDDVNAERSKLVRKLSSLQGQRDSLDRSAKKVADMEGETCPTCQQLVGQEHVADCWAEVKTQAKQLDRDIKDVEKQIDELDNKNKELEKVNKDWKETINKLNKDIQERQSEMYEAKHKFDEITSDIKTLTNQKKKLENADNPFTRLKAKTVKQIKSLKVDKIEIENELKDSEATLEAVKYWVKGFKDVRLFLVEEAITQLELECNNYLSELGLVDWSVKFAVERENKSGGVTRGFDVQITPPGTNKPTPWASYSGGETQRLRVAGALGLSNLILSRKGMQGATLILDEPTPFLNDSGVQDLLESLQAYAENNDRVIWLIDHRTLSFGGFKTTTVVTKTNEGSAVLPKP